MFISDSVLLNQDLVVLNSDSVLLNQDLVVLNSDSVLLNQDLVVLNSDSVLLSQDLVVLNSDSVLLNQDLVVLIPDSVLSSRNLVVFISDSAVDHYDTNQLNICVALHYLHQYQILTDIMLVFYRPLYNSLPLFSVHLSVRNYETGWIIAYFTWLFKSTNTYKY